MNSRDTSLVTREERDANDGVPTGPTAPCAQRVPPATPRRPREVRTMRPLFLARVALALGAGLLLPSVGPAQTITLNQTDTFESGTTLNWTNGQSLGALSIASGGPAGSADHYLQVTANG